MPSEDVLAKRVLPHNSDAEKAVVGSMLMDEEALAQALEILTAGDFYLRQYGIVFEAMAELYARNSPVDPLTLTEQLRMKDVPEEFTSPRFLADILDSVPTSANIRQYAQVVSDDALLRRLIKVSDEISGQCYQHKEQVADIVDSAEKRIFEVLSRKKVDDYVPISEVVLQVIDKIDRAGRLKGHVTGIASGFYELDYMTSGFLRVQSVCVSLAAVSDDRNDRFAFRCHTLAHRKHPICRIAASSRVLCCAVMRTLRPAIGRTRHTTCCSAGRNSFPNLSGSRTAVPRNAC